jgi:branched-subunit amino acid aminotransferase/4-amino-4-deoxychorismate lyase
MIWVRGEVVGDETLEISVLDRTFEHGLGLFETIRTWNGHATLLSRHVERMVRSATKLGLPLEEDQLPNARDVAFLIAASQARLPSGQDVRLRLTLTGGMGTAPASGSVLWMTVGALSRPPDRPGAIVTRSVEISADDPLARHKTLNYWRKRIAYDEALESESDEVLCLAPGSMILEGTRTNLFLVEGRRLCTPGVDAPLLPGVMRQVVLDRAAQLGLEIDEGPLPLARIEEASEAFLTSSVRGMLPIARLMSAGFPAPGPVTRHLWSEILPWLESGGSAR